MNMLDIKPGSWLVTSYNVPNDIAVPIKGI